MDKPRSVLEPCGSQIASRSISGMRALPRLVDTVKDRSGADPFVIALAATHAPKMVVLTEEQRGKTKIPDVCVSERIDWCGLADFIEREDWKFE